MGLQEPYNVLPQVCIALIRRVPRPSRARLLSSALTRNRCVAGCDSVGLKLGMYLTAGFEAVYEHEAEWAEVMFTEWGADGLKVMTPSAV